MQTEKLNKCVARILKTHTHKGELTDGQALDAIYDLMSLAMHDDDKIYCINELLDHIKNRSDSSSEYERYFDEMERANKKPLSFDEWCNKNHAKEA